MNVDRAAQQAGIVVRRRGLPLRNGRTRCRERTRDEERYSSLLGRP